jgi:hypothetical protein
VLPIIWKKGRAQIKLGQIRSKEEWLLLKREKEINTSHTFSEKSETQSKPNIRGCFAVGIIRSSQKFDEDSSRRQ